MNSTFLASALGWYMTIIGLLMLLRRDQIKTVMTEMISQKSAVFLFGILSVIVGLLMVLSHNIWVQTWQVTVTIMAWLILISGLLRLFNPSMVNNWVKSVLKNKQNLVGQGFIVLLIGVYLLYKVYL